MALTLTLQEVQDLLELIPKLEQRITALEQAGPQAKALYDRKDLRERGYSDRETRRILKNYGKRLDGRLRIKHQDLMEYEA